MSGFFDTAGGTATIGALSALFGGVVVSVVNIVGNRSVANLQWKRDRLLPTVLTLLSKSKENRSHLVAPDTTMAPQVFSEHLSDLRSLSDEIGLLAPGLELNVTYLVNVNSVAVKAWRLGQPREVLANWDERISEVEQYVTRAARVELGLRTSARRSLVNSSATLWQVWRTRRTVKRALRHPVRHIPEGDPERPVVEEPPHLDAEGCDE